jgi:MFS family permease
MAFQFQSIAAIAPLLASKFGIGVADIGILIGLYFTPGVAFALPGGAIGQRFGDKATVFGALLLMLAGELTMALSDGWALQIASRLVAGAGGVLLNVLMTKMVADWFAGKEIATAMAVFVNSWPAGIALSLLALPLIATNYGVNAVHFAVATLIGLGIIIFAWGYRAPSSGAPVATASVWPGRRAILAVAAAGLIWGLYNTGFAMIFSFGPSLLVERAWPIATAASTISIVLWLAVFSVPAGGFLADRTRHPRAILIGGCILFAILMLLLPRQPTVTLDVIGLGLICGWPAGPILSLPAQVLQPATRATGMGLFYTLYYVVMMLGPVIAGACARWAGSTSAAFDFGAAALLACPVILWGFDHILKDVKTKTSSC